VCRRKRFLCRRPKPPMSRLQLGVGDWSPRSRPAPGVGTRVVGPGPRAGHPRRDACQPQGNSRSGVLIGGRGPSRRGRSSFSSGTRRAGIASAGPGLPRTRARAPSPRRPVSGTEHGPTQSPTSGPLSEKIVTLCDSAEDLAGNERVGLVDVFSHLRLMGAAGPAVHPGAMWWAVGPAAAQRAPVSYLCVP
jgi:hypothetical protein